MSSRIDVAEFDRRYIDESPNWGLLGAIAFCVMFWLVAIVLLVLAI